MGWEPSVVTTLAGLKVRFIFTSLKEIFTSVQDFYLFYFMFMCTWCLVPRTSEGQKLDPLELSYSCEFPEGSGS